MKKNRIKNLFLEQIKKIPIIEVACEKVGIARSSIYRWLSEDKEFSKELEKALLEGETRINELSKTQLISLIQEKNYPAISFWLRHRDPKFKDKIEINTASQPQNELTPEQQTIVREALRLASITPSEDENKKTNDTQ